jgi:hypothetical protein
MAQEVARFNVGGHKYEVSRSLLDAHPNTLLATSASERWQSDPEVEIFIDRNGGRFQYILDYLRDGKIVLPLDIPKECIISDLEYYSVDFEASNISYTFVGVKDYKTAHGVLFQKYMEMKDLSHVAAVMAACIERILANEAEDDGSFYLSYYSYDDQEAVSNLKHVMADPDLMSELNKKLEDIGIRAAGDRGCLHLTPTQSKPSAA